ncbi:MAG: RNA polymerase sigma factor, partial [Gemmatimonadota bacterium]
MSRLVGLELAGFHSGDGELFRRLVEQHSPRLLAIARSFAADVEEAHDLVQETWRRAFEKRRTYRGSGTLSGWLYAVCRSVCL